MHSLWTTLKCSRMLNQVQADFVFKDVLTANENPFLMTENENPHDVTKNLEGP